MKISKQLLKEIIIEECNMFLLEKAIANIGNINKLLNEQLEIGKTYVEDPPSQSVPSQAIEEKRKQLETYMHDQGLYMHDQDLGGDKLYMFALMMIKNINDAIKRVHKLRTQKIDPEKKAFKVAEAYYDKVEYAIKLYGRLAEKAPYNNLHPALTNLNNVHLGSLRGSFNNDAYKEFSRSIDEATLDLADTQAFALG